MDESVLRAMARWPDVPAVFGWLSLDRRGRWLLRGETLANKAALAFIARNYAVDDAGRWYFQNGPQRVFVSLQAAPLVFRREPEGGFTSHSGADAGAIAAVFMDERGNLWMDTAAGPGILDDRDLDAFSHWLCAEGGAALDEDALIERVDALGAGREAGLSVRLHDVLLPLAAIRFDDAPGQLGFVRSPQPDQNA